MKYITDNFFLPTDNVDVQVWNTVLSPGKIAFSQEYTDWGVFSVFNYLLCPQRDLFKACIHNDNSSVTSEEKNHRIYTQSIFEKTSVSYWHIV